MAARALPEIYTQSPRAAGLWVYISGKILTAMV